jgi:hypothetical protein
MSAIHLSNKELVERVLQDFMDSNAFLSPSIVERIKLELNELTHKLNIEPFYVYYTSSDIAEGRINVTHSKEEFEGVKSSCDFRGIEFIGR